MKTTWKIDREHSEMRFEADHLMISKVSGNITSFDASFETGENGFSDITKVRFTADACSLNTNSDVRDRHLKSALFFDCDQYGEIQFSGTNLIQGAVEPPVTFMTNLRNDFKLFGDLTIKGIKKPIVLSGLFGGTAIDPQGRKKVGFSFKGKINRTAFDLSHALLGQTGKVFVGEEVTLLGNCQFFKV